MTTLNAAQLLEQNQSLIAMLQLREATILAREATIARQQDQLTERDAKLVLRTGEVLHLTTWIEKLKLQIAVLKRLKFGRSSEKIDQEITQLELIVDELEAEQGAHAQMAAPAAAIDESLVESNVAEAATVPKRPRKLLPEHLEREALTYAAPCACPACGGTALRLLGEDVSEQLELVPEHFKVIRHVRPKLSCMHCQTIVQAPAPSRPVAKSPVGAGLLAHVMVGKYVDHLPLHRQSVIYARQGVELERSTLADWVGAAGYLIRPLVDAIKRHVMAATKLHTDDTPVPVLQPGRKTTKEGRLWVYVRDDSSSASTDPPAVWFAYSPDRKGIHPQTHLKGFTGTLQADAYGGYTELYKDGRITEAACWAHARRKFYELAKATDSPIAKLAIVKIAALYAIEAKIKGQVPEVRKQTRQVETLPLLNELHSWLTQTLAQTSAKSALALAINYSLKRWPALMRYAHDGSVEIDNNIAERQIRPVALGRKNYLFAGADSGGERAAAMYSILGTAKMNGLNPEAYLKFIFERINDHKVNAIDELLPWKVARLIEKTTEKPTIHHDQLQAA